MIQRTLRVLLLVLLPLAAVLPASAQDLQRIAAIVNDDVISGRDLERRLTLIAAATGQQPGNPEVRRRLRERALRSLVDERLQIQEAKRRNIGVTREEIERGFAVIAQQNRMSVEQFESALTGIGLARADLDSQISAEISWSKLIRTRLVPSVVIGDDEINTTVDRLRAGANEAEWQVSEIYLSVDNPDQDAEVRRTAERLVEQVRSGANFGMLARQFSQGTTAATGGDLGWVQQSTLSDELIAALERMQPGQVSDPVKVPGGYSVMRLSDRRQGLAGAAGSATIELKQIVLAIADQRERQSQLDLANQVAPTIGSCNDVEAVAKNLRSTESGSLGKLKLSDLPPNFRSAVSDLPVGKASVPVATERAVHIFVVCAREEPAIDRDQIRQGIMSRRVELMARRYMRDLRRDALVEVR